MSVNVKCVITSYSFEIKNISIEHVGLSGIRARLESKILRSNLRSLAVDCNEIKLGSAPQ